MSQEPSRWYLTGFLAPREAPASARVDETEDEEVDSAERGGADDAEPTERGVGQRARFPSSVGLSVICANDATAIEVVVRWGDYAPGTLENGTRPWRRTPREVRRTVAIPAHTKVPQREHLEGKHGLDLVVSVRPIRDQGRRVVSLFVVNERVPAGEADRDLAFVFQVRIEQGIEALTDPQAIGSATTNARRRRFRWRPAPGAAASSPADRSICFRTPTSPSTCATEFFALD